VSCLPHNVSSAYLAPRAADKAHKSGDDLEQVQEAFVIIIKALPKHQGTDHVGHSPAHEEDWVDWYS